MPADNLEITADEAVVTPPPAGPSLAAPGPRFAVLRGRIAVVRNRVAPFLPLIRVVGFAASVAIVVYIGIRAAQAVETEDLTWWPIPFAVLAAGTWWIMLGRGWSLIVSDRLTRRDLSIWCRTQALRFIPGGLWAPGSRAAVVRGGAVKKLSAVIAENVGALCAAVGIGGLALGLSGRPAWLPLALALAVPPIAARMIAARTGITQDRSVRLLANYVAGFLAYVVATVLVQGAVSHVSDPLAVAGAGALAWAAGLVVVIAPSGVGVRELVYVWFLSDTLPSGQLAAGAVTMRLVMIIAEFAILLFAGRPVAAAAEPAAAPADTS